MLYIVFFLSGCAALVFQAVWFRVAGLGLGNSVWASSIVLGSFMAGVGIGSYLTARFSSRIRRPLLIYAILEIVIAVVSVAVVLGFSSAIRIVTPLFQQNIEQATMLNAVRWCVSFSMFVLPAIAMGATLPVLVSAFSLEDQHFGKILGRLYGVNTLGAMAGAVVTEVWLLPSVGVRGAAITAGMIDLFCVLAALLIASRVKSSGQLEQLIPAATRKGGFRFLVSAALCGGALLALEVIWLRLLLLYVNGTSLAFSLVLAVVLFGIGVGGFIASRMEAVNPLRAAALLALSATISVTLGYLMLAHVKQPTHTSIAHPDRILAFASLLALVPSILSGMLFTLIGRQVHLYSGDRVKTTGTLTLSNTIGAALGSVIAGFVLIPFLGVEASIFFIALLYMVISFLLVDRSPDGTNRTLQHSVHGGVLIIALGCLLFFPFGAMRDLIIPESIRSYLGDDAKIEAVREGQSETAILVRHDLLGIPIRHRLVTNRISMSATTLRCRRYMRMYAYLPFAMKPDSSSALLICFGVGNTAQAITDSAALKNIDVVDISREILQLSRDSSLFLGQAHPLNDPRVKVHIEDGRFYLQATQRRYDIITGEPPPPGMAGIVNLYSREFFQLIHDRLTEGGIATYWLPLYLMSATEARAVTKSFLEVFPDATLWSGAGSDWMMLGTRNWKGPVKVEQVSSLFKDPRIGNRLCEVGIETPGDLGANFLADASELNKWTKGVAPVVDDFPHRLSGNSGESGKPDYKTPLYAERFQSSSWIAAHWSPEMIATSIPRFPVQAVVNSYFDDSFDWREDLITLLKNQDTATLQLIVLGVDPKTLDLIKTAGFKIGTSAIPDYALAVKSFADRDYRSAYLQFDSISKRCPDQSIIEELAVISAAISGDSDLAERGLERYLEKYPEDSGFREVVKKFSSLRSDL